MRKLLSTLVLVLVFIVQALAQNRTITGRVTDEAGNAVRGASVTIKGTKKGVPANADGVFTTVVPSTTSTIIVSAVGYVPQEVVIPSGQSTLNVVLKQDVSSLEQVVVTGYSREKKSQFSGAASIISAEKVSSVPVGSFDQALQGRAPGVLVNSGSGQPGASPQITIRGVQSVMAAGAPPLFIIDGVPTPSADFQSMNPSDFESITILKDASASALYGARGGTGVVVITTKRGKSGGTTIGVKTQFGFTQKPSFQRLNMMSTPEILQYEESMGLLGAPTNTPGWVYSLKNPANASLPATSPTTNPYAASKERYTAILDSIRGINNDYTDYFFRQGVSQSYEVNLNGGNEKTRFYLSTGYFGQQGIEIRSDLNRYTTRFNVDHTAGNLTVGLSSMLGYSKINFSEGDWLGNSPRNPFQMVYRAKPYENPYRADGSLNWGASTSLNLKQIANLLEGIQNSTYRDNQIKVNTALSLAYKIFPTLTLKNNIGVDVSSNIWQKTVQAGSYYGNVGVAFNSGEDRETYQYAGSMVNTTALIFNKKIQDIHEVELGGYFETVQGRNKSLGFALFNLDPRIRETGQGAGPLPTNGAATYPQNASSAKSSYGIRSYFGTGRYTYKGLYTINANLRSDATSMIAKPENKEIISWSAGFIWNAIKEKFLDKQNILSDLRLRASYGIVPNIGSIPTTTYAISGGIRAVPNYLGTQLPVFNSVTYAGSSTAGQAPLSPYNYDLKIEKVEKTNLGIDFALWRNRARFSLEWYNFRTKDLFVNQPLSMVTGFQNQALAINAGTMTNKGIEATASVDIIRKKNAGLTFGINHSINKNTIEDLGLVNEFFLGTFVIRKGLPYGSHYTYNYLGSDPTTGKPIYETLDGGKTNDIAKAGQFAKFGTYLPKHVGGFTLDGNYHGFSLSALFSYQFDVVRSDNTRNWITRGVPGYFAAVNQSREMLTDQWTKPGDTKFFQSPLYDRGFTSSDLRDAKFLRFRNITLGYQLPNINIGERKIMKGGKFYVQAQNIAVWSPWKGLDPEDNNNISLNEYPNPKAVVFGLDLNF